MIKKENLAQEVEQKLYKGTWDYENKTYIKVSDNELTIYRIDDFSRGQDGTYQIWGTNDASIIQVGDINLFIECGELTRFESFKEKPLEIREAVGISNLDFEIVPETKSTEMELMDASNFNAVAFLEIAESFPF